MPHDEITLDQQPDSRRQAEFIRKYCARLPERLHNSRSKEEARQILHDTCSEFEASCESVMVQRFLKQHAEGLFNKIWGSRK